MHFVVRHGTRLTCVVSLLSMFLLLSGSAQEPPVPYPLSREVQIRADELGIWSQVVRRPDQAIRYFDTLTAVDIVGAARARFRRSSSPEVEDYDIGFASTCVFIPNKPRTGFLEKNSLRVRQALTGLYLNKGKRGAFMKAINPALLSITKEKLFAVLGGMGNFGEYDREVIDIKKLP